MVEEIKSEHNSSQEKESVQIVSTTYAGENKLLVWTEEERAARQQELLDKADAFSPFTERTGEFRHPTAAPSGGFQLTDAA